MQNTTARPINRTAYQADLFQIEFCTITTRGLSTLSPLARSFVAFYLALIRLGYTQVKAPAATIAAAVYNAFGYTRSRRSADRAHAELAELGFIHRPNLRLKHDSKISVININLDRFSFLLQKRSVKSLHAPNLPTPKLTNNPPKLHTNDPDHIFSNSLKSKKHTKSNEQKNRFDLWQDPRIYTIKLVLAADRTPSGPIILRRAPAELAADPKWTADHWRSLTHAEREHVARAILIPRLQTIAIEPEPTLDRLIARISGQERPEHLDPRPDLPEPDPEPRERPPLILDQGELEILKSAALRAKKNY